MSSPLELDIAGRPRSPSVAAPRDGSASQATNVGHAGPVIRPPGTATVARVRAVVQRVSRASVAVDGETVAAIGPGLLVLLGVHREDGEQEADRLARKLLALRAFEDGEGRMNRSVGDVGGELLCVSQFTLYGDVRRGNRPSFAEAAAADRAEALYERVREALGARGGRFGAHMEVELVNDGPVTLLVDV